MRDPNRIPKMLKLIEKIWKENPDLRLGQLLDNPLPREELFYVEDDELEKALREHYNEPDDSC